MRTVALKDIVIIISEMIRERATAATTKGIAGLAVADGTNSPRTDGANLSISENVLQEAAGQKAEFRSPCLIRRFKNFLIAKFCGSMALVAARTIPYFDKVCKWSHMQHLQ